MKKAKRKVVGDGTVDEPIELVAYDPEWPRLFADERDRLLNGVSSRQIVAIEHFGSTAVHGLAAKPIIDLLVGADVWPSDPALRTRLVELGYEDLGEAGVPERIYCRRREPRAYNLALVAYAGSRWNDNLAIRNRLRLEPETCREYESIKRAALQAGAASLLDYSAHKAPFIARLLRKR
jgi:GrpB-like predicted nucleotidyltransferase (UPF0157 family)